MNSLTDNKTRTASNATDVTDSAPDVQTTPPSSHASGSFTIPPSNSSGDDYAPTVPCESMAVSSHEYDVYECAFRAEHGRTHTNADPATDSFHEYAPAYRYGYDTARDARFAALDWAQAESELRAGWERRRPGSWDIFRDAIEFAWEKTRDSRPAQNSE